MVDQFFLTTIGTYAIFILFIIFRRLGGYPEGWWRIIRRDYFVHRIAQPDRTFTRHVHSLDEIEVQSPPMFVCGGKRFNTNDQRMARDTGRPCWFHLPNEMEPIPLFDWKTAPNLDPSLIQAAYDDDSIRQFKEIGNRFDWRPWLLIGFGLLIVIIVAGASLYFSYDAHCALKPSSCGSVHP